MFSIAECAWIWIELFLTRWGVQPLGLLHYRRWKIMIYLCNRVNHCCWSQMSLFLSSCLVSVLSTLFEGLSKILPLSSVSCFSPGFLIVSPMELSWALLVSLCRTSLLSLSIPSIFYTIFKQTYPAISSIFNNKTPMKFSCDRPLCISKHSNLRQNCVLFKRNLCHFYKFNYDLVN